MASAVDEDWKGVSKVYTLGGNQEMAVIWEPGIYQLLATSRKPKAKVFQKWLFEEVLPSIRKTGKFESTTNPKLPQNYLEALKALVHAEEQKALLTAKVEHDAPLVEYAENVMASDTDIDFNSFAKMMGTGRTRLFRDLREMGIVMQNSTLPYQKWMDAGYFEAHQEITLQGKLEPFAVITGKGQLWLSQRLKSLWSQRKQRESQTSLFPDSQLIYQ